MLNIIFATANDLGYEIALKLSDQGNLVKLYNGNNFKPPVLGSVKRIYSYEESLSSADLLIAYTPISTLDIVNQARDLGIPTYGGGAKASVLCTDDKVQSLVTKMFYKETTDGIPIVVSLYRQGDKWSKFSTIGYWNYRILEGERGPILSYGPSTGWMIDGGDHTVVEQVKKTFNATFDGIHCPVTLPITLLPSGFVLTFPIGSTPFLDCSLLNIMSYYEMGKSNDLSTFFYSLTTEKELQWYNNKVVIGLALWNDHLLSNKGAEKHIWTFPEYHKCSYVSAEGDTFRESNRRVMRTVVNCTRGPDLAYRIDGISDAIYILNEMIKGGWLDANKVRKLGRSDIGEYQRTGSLVQEDRKDRKLVTQELSQSAQASHCDCVQ